jgi:hypothetical protein
VITLRLFVAGHVAIESDSWLDGYPGAYYTDEPPYPKSLSEYVEEAHSKRLHYTVFDRVPMLAEDCTDDLWFSEAGVPGNIKMADLVLDFKGLLIFTLILIAFISYISAGLAGLIFFRDWKNISKMGLFNLLTILCLFLRVAGHSDFRQAVRFSIVFSIIFDFLTILVYVVFAELAFSP